MPNAQPVAGANEWQPEQPWIPLDPLQQIGIGGLQVLESGVDVSRALGVKQSRQAKPIDEPLDLRECHGLLLQIDQVDRHAAFFEESLGGPSRLRILHTEDLDIQHMA